MQTLAESYWWLIHHSDDPRRRMLALAQYVDESGGDEHPRVAVMGGPVFARDGFLALTRQWVHTLDVHRVKPPIHMKEFARPHGRLAYLTNEERFSLFSDLVPLINQQKVYSLTVAVNNLTFQTFSPKSEYRGRFGSTALAFLWCLVLNHNIVHDHKDAMDCMAYVLSDSPNNIQMADCYNFFRSFERKTGNDLTGSFSLDDPKRLDALQAADMIAWAKRREWLEEPFDNGFGPLADLTRKLGSAENKPIIHFHFNPTAKSTRRLARIFGKPVRGKGARVSLLQEFRLS